MDTIIAVVIFISVLLLIEMGFFALRAIRNPEKRTVAERLRMISTGKDETEKISILRREVLSEIPWLHRLLSKIAFLQELNSFLQKSGSKHTLGIFLLVSLLFAFLGYLAGTFFLAGSMGVLWSDLVAVPSAVAFGLLPFLFFLAKKKRRLARFEAQLPEALELIARSLKAGHAFSSGLKYVADEMGDPVSAEFNQTLAEINFGVGVAEALRNLTNRVDCEDLKFFVISIVLQRETGGNLAEILENLASLIRERFKLQGKVRILSSQAKLSAYILVALPFVLALVISFIRPGYFNVFFTDPTGRSLLLFAVILLILGIVSMKKMIAIKV